MATDFWGPSPSNDWWRPTKAQYFDTEQLQRADILLFAPHDPKTAQAGIIGFQRAIQRFDPEQACFTHAALFVGYDHLLCESLFPQGVVYSSLAASVNLGTVMVRRFPGLSDEDRSRILIAATGSLSVAYGWREVLRRSVQPDYELSAEAEDGLICSRLCERALLHALMESRDTESLSLHCGRNWVTPAALRATPNLEDVGELELVQVPSHHRADPKPVL